MSHRLKSAGSVNVLRFPGTLDAFQMVRLKPHLTRLLNRHPKLLLLDLAATRQVELSGLGILIDRLRRPGNGHSKFQFLNVSPQVHRTLARAGVDGFLAS